MYAPYICIQGVTEPSELEALADLLDNSHAEKESRAPHILALGVHIKAENPDPPPPRYVIHEKLDTILQRTYSSLQASTCLHLTSDERQTIGYQILGVYEKYQPAILQINVDSPRLDPLFDAIFDYIFLRIGSETLNSLQGDPARIAAYVKSYSRGITGITLDASAGHGIQLDVNFTLACLEAIRRADPDIGLGIAGGLDADSLPRILPIIREFPHISISAEGRLRTPDDKLDITKAVAFIEKAYELFDSVL